MTSVTNAQERDEQRVGDVTTEIVSPISIKDHSLNSTPFLPPIIKLNLPTLNTALYDNYYNPGLPNIQGIGYYSNSLWYQGLQAPEGKLNITPIGYRYDNRVEKYELGGYRGLYGVTPSFTMGVSSQFSSGYSGHFLPHRINSVAMGLEFHIKVTENFSIHGGGVVGRSR